MAGSAADPPASARGVVMSIARNFGPVAQQMTEALQRYSREELVDLLTHIVKTYVVEGTLPLKPDVGARMDDAHLAGLSFPQLILHLQMRLDHREWSLFSVSGEDVWVSSGGQRVNVTGRSTALPAAAEPLGEPLAGPTPPPRAATAGAGAPHPPAAAEPPPAPSAAPVQEAAPDGEAAPPPGESSRSRVPEPFSESVQTSERFGMLEID